MKTKKATDMIKKLISPVKTFANNKSKNNKNIIQTKSDLGNNTTTTQKESVKLTLETRFVEENTNNSNNSTSSSSSTTTSHSSSNGLNSTNSERRASKRSSSDFTFGREHLVRQPGYERFYGDYAKETIFSEITSKFVGMRGNLINLSQSKDQLLGTNVGRVNDFFKSRIAPWVGSNVPSPVIRPPNHLYIYGPAGVGAYTSTLINCHNYDINMIFVNPTCRVSGMMTKIYDRARDLQPCVVFFDSADGLVSTTARSKHTAVRYHNYFGEWWHAINHQSNAHFNSARVWTIMSGSGDPLKLQCSYLNLLKTRGAVALINVPDSTSREKFFFSFGQSITTSKTVPDSSDDDWIKVARHFSRISDGCTYKEMQTYLLQLFADHHSTSSCSDDNDSTTSLTISSSSSNSFEFPDTEYFIEEFNSVCKKFYDQESHLERKTISQIDLSSNDPITHHAKFDITYDLFLISSPRSKKFFKQDKDRDISSTFSLASSSLSTSKSTKKKKSVSFSNNNSIGECVNLTSPKSSLFAVDNTSNDPGPYSPKYFPDNSDDNDNDNNEKAEISDSSSGVYGSYINNKRMGELKKSLSSSYECNPKHPSFTTHPSAAPYSPTGNNVSNIPYSPTSPVHSPSTTSYSPGRRQITYDDLIGGMNDDDDETPRYSVRTPPHPQQSLQYQNYHHDNFQNVSSNQININSVSNFLDSISSSSTNNSLISQTNTLPVITNYSGPNNNNNNSNIIDSQRGVGSNRHQPYSQRNRRGSRRGGRRRYNNNRRRYNKKQNRTDPKRSPPRRANKKPKPTATTNTTTTKPSTKTSSNKSFVDSLFD